MNTISCFLAAFLMLSVSATAQDEQRPGVQAPGFWLISPTNPTAGAVGLECMANMRATYTMVFPEVPPTLGQSMVVTRIDEETRRVYTTWVSIAAALTNIAHVVANVEVDLPVIAQNSTYTMAISVDGVTVGSVVSISPTSDLPDGIIIGSARVVEGGKVQVRVVNVSAAAIDCEAMRWSVACTASTTPK